jgi:hypothetical protein
MKGWIARNERLIRLSCLLIACIGGLMFLRTERLKEPIEVFLLVGVAMVLEGLYLIGGWLWNRRT